MGLTHNLSVLKNNVNSTEKEERGPREALIESSHGPSHSTPYDSPPLCVL